MPGGALDLETGGQVGGGAAASTYGGGSSLDLDDGFDDAPADLGAALELDLPGGARQHGASAREAGGAIDSSASAGPFSPAGEPPGISGPGGHVVPELAFDAAPSSRKPALGAPPAQREGAAPPPSSSGALPARTSGAHGPAGASGALPAARTSGPHAAAAPPSSSASGGYPPAPPSSSGGLGPYGNAGPPSAPGSSPGAPGSSPGSAPGMAPRRDAAAVIARYPAPPEQILGAPRYAIRVLLRQLELRTELESLRRRRSPDVKLYEGALRAYEPRTFKLGVAINCAALVIATFIFFLPVIIRFMRAD